MIIAVMIFSSGFSGITVFSRIAYSMARDGAFPCSGYLKELDPKTKVPVRVIAILFTLISLLSMLPLVSHDAFTAILQISTFSIQVCYAIPIYLRLTHSRGTFEQHPGFSLGKASVPLSCISLLWLLFTSLVMLLPSFLDPSSIESKSILHYLNPTPLILLLVLSLAYAYWTLGGARDTFRGPRRGPEHADVNPQGGQPRYGDL